MSELTVLQAVRLKGRASVADVTATLAEDPATVAATIAELAQSGLLVEATRLKLSAEGKARLGELLTHERSAFDSDAMTAAYEAFRAVNADFKALIADWQLKDGTLNPHDDAEYDSAVLTRLDIVHEHVVPIIAVVAGQVPRVGAYSLKLTRALANVKAGETSWLTRPVVDSYHTVWFELHEELILAAGLTRADEARAGHAH